jgi:two-component system cell cycle response regulator
VAVTANAMVGDRDHALAAGFDGYLTKPIEPTTFARSIDLFLPVELRGGTSRDAAAQTPERR